MAKKKSTKKISRPKRKSAKAKVVAAPVVTKEAPKSGSNLLRIGIIAVVIFAAVVVFAMVLSQMRASQLEKQAAVPTAVPTIVVATNPGTIEIKDPNTNKSAVMTINPASASTNLTPAQAATAAAVAAQGAKAAAPTVQPAPVESPTSTNIPLRCRVYRKDVDSKANIHRIDIEDAKYLYDSGRAVFVDARGPNEYLEAHIKGALNVPVNATAADIAKLKDQLTGKIIVTYCHGVGCHLSDKSAYLLYDAGYRKLAIFFGGWPKWNEHKYPIVTKAPVDQPQATTATAR
jgi:rhodanese-related sulfurtransferase